MKLIDGNTIAKTIIEDLTETVGQIKGEKPCVAFIRVGDDPASVSYVRKKQKTAEAIGIDSELTLLEETVHQDALFEVIERYNRDQRINGILIQAPLPRTLMKRQPSTV